MSSAPAEAPKKRKHDAVSPPPLKKKIQSTTTKANISAFFTPTSEKEPDRTTWATVKDSLLIARYKSPVSNGEGADETPPSTKRCKIAAFDLDSTLILTVSGNKFGRDGSDWKWWSPVIPSVLRDLYASGHQVVIFSNQAGLSLRKDSKTAKTDAKRLSDFKIKAGAVLRQLDLPINLYAATERDNFRKPRTGMWREMLDDHELEGEVNLGESFFVGDAGGRLKSDGQGSSDFSSSDRDFATNIGMTFHTPEEYFLGEKPRAFTRAFSPSTYLKTPSTASESAPFAKLGSGQELVLLCGSPGSGKSTFYWNQLKPLGYERVNQDILKTRERCLARAQELLAKGLSVAVDNTNADVETRAHWINLARQSGEVVVRCVRLTADAQLSKHNDTVRALSGALMNPEARTMLPGAAFTGFQSRFREPRLEEGFADIITVDFAFSGTAEQREVWKQYWT